VSNIGPLRNRLGVAYSSRGMERFALRPSPLYPHPLTPHPTHAPPPVRLPVRLWARLCACDPRPFLSVTAGLGLQSVTAGLGLRYVRQCDHRAIDCHLTRRPLTICPTRAPSRSDPSYPQCYRPLYCQHSSKDNYLRCKSRQYMRLCAPECRKCGNTLK